MLFVGRPKHFCLFPQTVRQDGTAFDVKHHRVSLLRSSLSVLAVDSKYLFKQFHCDSGTGRFVGQVSHFLGFSAVMLYVFRR